MLAAIANDHRSPEGSKNATGRKTRAGSITDRLMAEPIHMPGFPQLVVTRGFCYRWLKGCGWPTGERGFGGLDYMVFGTPATSQPLTDEAARDNWLGQVRGDYLRDDA